MDDSQPIAQDDKGEQSKMSHILQGDELIDENDSEHDQIKVINLENKFEHSFDHSTQPNDCEQNDPYSEHNSSDRQSIEFEQNNSSDHSLNQNSSDFQNLSPQNQYCLNDELISDQTQTDELDEQQLEIDKQKVQNHPLFQLLVILFEHCESFTHSIITANNDDLNKQILHFIECKQQNNEPFLTNDKELDTLMILGIQNLRINLLELQKVQELCRDFCVRYRDCLKNKMHPDTLLQGTSNQDEFDLDLSSDLSSNEDDEYAYVTAKSKSKKQTGRSSNKKLIINEDEETTEVIKESNRGRNRTKNVDKCSTKNAMNKDLNNELKSSKNKNATKGESSVQFGDESSANFQSLILDSMRDTNINPNDLRLFYEQMMKLNEQNQQFNNQLNSQFGGSFNQQSNDLFAEHFNDQSNLEQQPSNEQFKKSKSTHSPSTKTQRSHSNQPHKKSKRSNSINLESNLINEPSTSSHQFFYDSSTIGDDEYGLSSLRAINTLSDSRSMDDFYLDADQDGQDDYQSNRKSQKRGVLPKRATQVMRQWLFQHVQHPYPSDEEKKELARETNLKLLQVARRSIYVLFVIGLILATFTSMIFQLLSIEEGEYEKSQFVAPNLSTKDNDSIRIDDQLDHTFVFAQISDIHLSIYFDLSRKDDFRLFCTELVDIVRPKVVIASGDLTDSRSKDPLGSGQFEQEWIWYNEILQSTNVTNKTVWLDIRGNHDNFDIFDWNSPNNFYRIYSNHGKHSERHYHYNFQDENDMYTFIAIESCFNPSPKRPFNFLGMLEDHDIATLQNIRDSAIQNGTNYTIWFAHYPTSSIIGSQNLKPILNGPLLCGHFHTLSNLVDQIYSTHREGVLELEVGDFKDNRLFRVAAIDHGLFSFVDVKLREYPIILITNPKCSKFNMPGYEPIHRVEQSTNIRVLVYSIAELVSVRVRIDNSNYVDMEPTANKNLYVIKWDPKQYKNGLHRITVKAKDALDNERRVSHTFSFDNSREDFSFGGRFLLRISMRSFTICLYLIGLSICLTPLLIAFYLYGLNKGRMLKARAKYSSFYKSLFKLYLLGSQQKISLVLIAIPLYLFVGPWYIGHVLTDHIGVGFVWGIAVNINSVQTFKVLPTVLTYILGLMMIVLFHLPITCTLAHMIYCNYVKIEDGLLEKSFYAKYIHLRHFFYIFIVFCNSLISYSFVYAYGIYTVIFGFGITYPLAIYLALFYHVNRIKATSFPEEIRPRFKKSPLEDSLLESTKN